MNIAVNTRLLLPGKLEGIGWFTYETLKRITQKHQEHTFYFIFDRSFDKQFIFSENIIPVVVGPQARHPFLYYLWFEYSVKKTLRKIKADIFLSPDGFCMLKPAIPSLIVMHDLNFEYYPKDLPWLTSHYYRYFFPRFAQNARRIATVSEFSKNDIQKHYHIDSDKIDVVYNGANGYFQPVGEDIKYLVKKQYTKGKDFFIFIGALLPRKNLRNLFIAYDIFRKKSNKEIKLLIVGARKWWTPEIEKTFSRLQYKEDIIFTGRLETAELFRVLASSLALTYVSIFEGFGIPILEAFQCNVPVITSNVTSMPEVAGDAALLIDPFNPDSISKAMCQIAEDKDLSTNLIEKASLRKNYFSWDKTAELLWQSIIRTKNP
ncbi:MAG: glycosyltransferase family 1 protein [Bacteroidales bacterium]|nr:glycosyltransferase family 4 protein [Bacteroidales bacterium]MDD4214213.1 glycosyltransferase family 1 protein [Bacteroidales bacterium]